MKNKILVVGFGEITANWLNNYIKLGIIDANAEIIDIEDADEESVRELEKQLGIPSFNQKAAPIYIIEPYSLIEAHDEKSFKEKEKHLRPSNTSISKKLVRRRIYSSIRNNHKRGK